jgi:hypothetical protein
VVFTRVGSLEAWRGRGSDLRHADPLRDPDGGGRTRGRGRESVVRHFSRPGALRPSSASEQASFHGRFRAVVEDLGSVSEDGERFRLPGNLRP